MLFVPLAGALGALAWSVKEGLNHYGILTGGGWPLHLFLLTGATLAGSGVAGAWLGLALSGRRRTEPGWIDLLGRAVGTLWVIHLGVVAVIVWIQYLPR